MKKQALIVLAGIVVIVGGFFAFNHSIYWQKQHGGWKPPPNIPEAGSITVKGTVLCLPHRDTSGPQTTECAFGIKDMQDRYFALHDSDSAYVDVSELPFNVDAVEITGTFTPRTKSNYQDIGVIEIETARLTAPLPVKLGETLSAFGVSITPEKVLEDSRCPIDVTCIWAGTVRVEVTLVSGLGTAKRTFSLGGHMTTESEIITLESVDPAPRSTDAPGSRTYVFHFSITKR